MAYAFNRTMQALGQPDDDEKQQQANIFAPEGAAPGAQPASGASNSRIMSGTTEGSFGPADQGGGSFAPNMSPPDQAGTSTTGAQNRLLKANKGKVKAPVDLGGLSTRIKETGDAAQAEADSYIDNADNRFELQAHPGGSEEAPTLTMGLSDADTDALTSYIDTGDSRYGIGDEGFGYNPDPVALLTAGNAGLVDPFELRTDTDVGPLDQLSTDAGLQQLFRSRGDAEYGGNEAALDTALLRGDAAFNTQRDAVLNEGRAFNEAINKIKTETQQKAQNQRDSAYGTWRATAGDYLSDISGGIESSARAAEKAFDDELMNDSASSRANSVMESLKANPEFFQSTYGEGYSDYLDPGLVNAADFYSNNGLNAQNTSWEQFLSGGDASKFERIMGLLGKGSPVTGAGDYYGASALDHRSGFDTAGYQKALLEAAAAARDKALAKPSSSTEPPAAPTGMDVGQQPYNPLDADYGAGDEENDWTEAEEVKMPWTPTKKYWGV